MSKIFCNKCGTELDASTKFCKKCGNKIQNDNIPNPVVNNIEKERPQAVQSKLPEKHNKAQDSNSNSLIISLILIILIILVGGFLFINSREGNSFGEKFNNIFGKKQEIVFNQVQEKTDVAQNTGDDYTGSDTSVQDSGDSYTGTEVDTNSSTNTVSTTDPNEEFIKEYYQKLKNKDWDYISRKTRWAKGLDYSSKTYNEVKGLYNSVSDFKDGSLEIYPVSGKTNDYYVNTKVSLMNDSTGKFEIRYCKTEKEILEKDGEKLLVTISTNSCKDIAQ